MALTIESFEDLVHVIETHPEWRRRLKKALFDIDLEAAFTRLEKALEKLIETQQQQTSDIVVLKDDVSVLKDDVSVLKDDVSVLKDDVSVLKTDVAGLKTDVSVLKTDMSAVKTDVARLKIDMSAVKTDVSTLKGQSYERDYRDKVNGIFGRFIRRGRDRTDDVADQLHDAAAAGQISDDDIIGMLAADLLWGGQLRSGDREVVIVLEESWHAETHDVEQAHQRAAVLRLIELPAIPAVAGITWDEQARSQADARGVVVATDGLVDAESWHKALSTLSL